MALFFLISGILPLFAQDAASPKSQFQIRIEETARSLASVPHLKHFSPEKRQAIVEFVFGNVLFAAAHELGHGVVREMELPVLGREEDAADAFAIISALNVGTDFSHRVLVEAVKGWFLGERRDEKSGEKFAYYDEHGMNLQRAYQIVCFMVGSDPRKFKDLAEETKLPDERQESCKGDYRESLWSWETSLKSHLRRDDQPKQKIEVIYGEGKADLEPYAKSFRNTQFLETIVERVADRFAWPRPLVIEMKTCDDGGTQWKAARLTVCYELAQEFSQLYRDFGAAEFVSVKPKQRR